MNYIDTIFNENANKRDQMILSISYIYELINNLNYFIIILI